jgi:hypothetical protein
MLTKKIVSGGKTGADRAALDLAIGIVVFHRSFGFADDSGVHL